jgi:hypothetical protein
MNIKDGVLLNFIFYHLNFISPFWFLMNVLSLAFTHLKNMEIHMLMQKHCMYF